MGWSHVLANRLLGAWCGWLTGRKFHDIGPLRLIERGLFHRLQMREWTFGWTVEAQITAARLGAAILEVRVRERPPARGVSRRYPEGQLAADAFHRLADRAGGLAHAATGPRTGSFRGTAKRSLPKQRWKTANVR